jgi:hypothetical protein
VRREQKDKRNRSFVIPGQREAMSPESITPVFQFSAKLYHRGYGFRACAKRRIPE